jgi:hypothetical protein
VHLPFHQQMIFDPTADASDILDAAERCSSTLLEWFALNIRDSNARRLKYVEIPEFYVWKDGTWCARSNNRMAVGRLFYVSPRSCRRPRIWRWKYSGGTAAADQPTIGAPMNAPTLSLTKI